MFITQKEQQRHHLHHDMIHHFDPPLCTTQLRNVLICDYSELVKVEKCFFLLFVSQASSFLLCTKAGSHKCCNIYFNWKTKQTVKINAIIDNACKFQIRKMHIKKPAFGTKLLKKEITFTALRYCNHEKYKASCECKAKCLSQARYSPGMYCNIQDSRKLLYLAQRQ